VLLPVKWFVKCVYSKQRFYDFVVHLLLLRITLVQTISIFFLNVSRRAAKFIDKRENGQETHTAQFVGKPGETLNNGNATPKAPQHIQDEESE
jgi:hypothetical protein